MPERITRRNFLGQAGAIGLTVLATDRLAGALQKELFMDYSPEAELVTLGPTDKPWLLVAGGLANDGAALARCLRYGLEPSTIVGVRYAENNMDSSRLYNTLRETADRYKLGGDANIYLGSAALTFMKAPLTKLVEDEVIHPNRVVIDSGPAGPGDIRGLEGLLVQGKADVALSESRIYNALKPTINPSLSDRDLRVPPQDLQTHFQAMRNTDSITLGVQAAAIRDNQLTAGSLTVIANAAEHMDYIRSQVDPLINTATAVPNIQSVMGNATLLREHIDPYRRPDSHAAGPEYPRYVGELLASGL